MAMLQLTDTTRVFPSIQGQNPDGRTLRLPEDFAGDLNVVLIAFTREQQADVDSWTPALDSLRARYPELRVYELPATITLYIDKGPFKRALGFTWEDRIQVLLVDSRGHIRWQRSGPYAASLRIELEAQLRR